MVCQYTVTSLFSYRSNEILLFGLVSSCSLKRMKTWFQVFLDNIEYSWLNKKQSELKLLFINYLTIKNLANLPYPDCKGVVWSDLIDGAVNIL